MTVIVTGEEEDWQSVSERNNNAPHSRSSDSESEPYPTYVTAYEMPAFVESHPQISSSHIDPAVVFGPMDDLSMEAEGHNKLHRNSSTATLPSYIPRAPAPAVNGNGDTSSDLENCDDPEVNALRSS